MSFGLASGALRRLALSSACRPGARRSRRPSSARQRPSGAALLRGLFDSRRQRARHPGQGRQHHDWRRATWHCLEAVQRVLAPLRHSQRPFIANAVQPDRQCLPDGKEGMRLYSTNAQHELVICGRESLLRLPRSSVFDMAQATRGFKALASPSNANPTVRNSSRPSKRSSPRHANGLRCADSRHQSPSMPTASWSTIAASSHCRPMAPACSARSIWRAW